jgi:hypothetical protein
MRGLRAEDTIVAQKEREARRIGLGIAAGILLAVLGATEIFRNAWLSLVTSPHAQTTSAIGLFSAYLVQTFLLASITFRAYRYGHYGISAASWILATTEAVASVLRRDLLLIKNANPVLYDITALLHVVSAASLFLAMGYRSHVNRQQDLRDARLGAAARTRR